MEKETYTLGDEAITCPHCGYESYEYKRDESYTRDDFDVCKHNVFSPDFTVCYCGMCNQYYLVQLDEGKILNYRPKKRQVTRDEQIKKNAERREATEELRDVEFEVVQERCRETGEFYIEGYKLGDRNLLPETYEFDTLDEFLEHLIVSVEALDSHFYRTEWKDQELRDLIYKAKVEILTEYFEKSSNPGFFESKKDYYKRRLDYALVIARSASYSIVNRDMHYYDDEDRYNPEYTSVNSDVNYLVNAKKLFEETEETDPYVLELADSLSRRYDYSY